MKMTYEALNQQDSKGTIKTFTSLRAAKRYAKSIAGGFDNGGVVRDATYKSRGAIYTTSNGWDFSRCPYSWSRC